MGGLMEILASPTAAADTKSETKRSSKDDESVPATDAEVAFDLTMENAAAERRPCLADAPAQAPEARAEGNRESADAPAEDDMGIENTTQPDVAGLSRPIASDKAAEAIKDHRIPKEARTHARQLERILQAWSGTSAELRPSEKPDVDVDPADGAAEADPAVVTTGVRIDQVAEPGDEPPAESPRLPAAAVEGKAPGTAPMAAPTRHESRWASAELPVANDSGPQPDRDTASAGLPLRPSVPDRQADLSPSAGATADMSQARQGLVPEMPQIGIDLGVALSSPRDRSYAATTLSPASRSIAPHSASILRQVGDAVVRAKGEQVEISLSPEELGKVRMVLASHNHAPHITIWAERPETLDQLRRHAEVLIQQFSEDGLGDATLDFRDRQQARDQQDRASAQGTGEPGDEFGSAVPVQIQTVGPARYTAASDGRLDIRL